MPEISIERRNCIDGLWSVPDNFLGREVTAAEMIEHHISQAEGRPVELSKLSTLSMNFTPHNPEDEGGHGVRGVVNIVYEFSDSE